MSLDCYVKMRTHFGVELRPHLIDGAIELLEHNITADTEVLEIGAGSSTVWFAEHAGHVTSFENNRDFYNTVLEELVARGLDNVQLQFMPDYPTKGIGIKGVDLFDVIVIDGRGRVHCVQECYKLLAPGGLLVLDDSQRPKYKTAINLLDGLGWECRHFEIDFTNDYGYRPRTSVWRRGKKC